ncbi:T9SS type A sorting domain-containing protein [Croceimicrobium sp.]|uniref:T9SS type A sorting domain-containing protein n=1 Tax=Croceimicrobium sp. TaxID=2828340 RepID=UPI003BA93FE7
MRLTLVFLLLTASLFAQPINRIYANFGSASVAAGMESKEGDYLIAGSDLSNIRAIQFGRFDSLGGILSLKTYDYTSDSIYRSIPCFSCMEENGGRIYFAQYDLVRGDSALTRFTKLDGNLDTVMTKKLLEFQGAMPVGCDLKFDTDSTFLISGYLYRNTSRNKYDLWVGRFDTLFNPLWQLRIEDSLAYMNGGYFGEDLLVDAYGSLLVSGMATGRDPTALNQFVHYSYAARIDRFNGKLIWLKHFDKDIGSQNFSAVDNENGSYTFIRRKVLRYWPRTDWSFTNELLIGQLDTNGTVLWDRRSGPILQRFDFTDLIKTSDGNLYVSGLLDTANQQLLAGYKFNSAGDSLWFRTYYHDESTDWHYAWRFFETSDSGIMHLGSYVDVNHSLNPDRLQYFWLLRTDKHGCDSPGCHRIGLPQLDLNSTSHFNLFPNPTTDYAILQWNWYEQGLEGSGKVELFDATGKVLWSQSKVVWTENQLIIPVSFFGPGVYYLRVLKGLEVIYQKKIAVN